MNIISWRQIDDIERDSARVNSIVAIPRKVHYIPV